MTQKSLAKRNGRMRERERQSYGKDLDLEGEMSEARRLLGWY
jgi:hypothetical protein